MSYDEWIREQSLKALHKVLCEAFQGFIKELREDSNGDKAAHLDSARNWVKRLLNHRIWPTVTVTHQQWQQCLETGFLSPPIGVIGREPLNYKNSVVLKVQCTPTDIQPKFGGPDFAFYGAVKFANHIDISHLERI